MTEVYSEISYPISKVSLELPNQFKANVQESEYNRSKINANNYLVYVSSRIYSFKCTLLTHCHQSLTRYGQLATVKSGFSTMFPTSYPICEM